MKRALITLSAIILFAFSSYGQAFIPKQIAPIPLWPDGFPEKEYEARPDDFQKKVLPKDFMEPKLEVYPAMKPNGLCILECPGGGYTMLSDSHEGRQMAQWFNALGITYCVLEYRLPFGFSYVPLHDAERAMSIIREHAGEWGVEHIGVMGCSAGGHLASTLATHYSSPETRPEFQILLYPVITMEASYTHMGSRHNLIGDNPSEELENEFCNQKHVTAETAPAIMILSNDDTTVDPKNSIEYYYALRKAGVSASLHIYPVGGHGYGNLDFFAYKREWTAEVERWLGQLSF